MNILDLLSKENMILDLQSTTKEAVIDELTNRFYETKTKIGRAHV